MVNWDADIVAADDDGKVLLTAQVELNKRDDYHKDDKIPGEPAIYFLLRRTRSLPKAQ